MKKMSVLIPIVAIALIFASCDSDGDNASPPSPNAYSLSVVRNWENGGNVSVIVNGSTLSNPGALTRAAGTVVTVTATPASGFTFQNWTATSGSLPTFIGGSATSAVITFQMNRHVLIRANFQAAGGGTRYSLTVNRNTAAGGSVKVNNVNTNPSAPLSFIAGAQVSLSATPASGFTFIGWSAQGGNVANANSATTTIQVNSNATVTANFQASGNPNPTTTYTLTVNANPGSGGSVSRNPSKASYTPGETVQITASPYGGWNFQGWSGANVANASSAITTIQMNGNAVVTASFQQQSGGGTTYTLTVNANPGNGGSVSRNPNKSSYSPGERVTITANAYGGWNFQNWSGANVDNASNASTQITMNGNATVTANFQQQQVVNPTTYTLNVNKNPDYGGSVSRNPDKSNYNPGETVTITANPSGGWNFQNWSGANVANGNSASTTIQMNGNATVTANFQQQQGGGGNGDGSVTKYPWPDGMPRYNGVTMTAGGLGIDLYSVKVNNSRTSPSGGGDWRPQNERSEIPVAMFDVNGSASISVNVPSASGVVVRPKSFNINPSVNGNTISFNIPGPGQYSVEWNNGGDYPQNPQNALLIFANPVESFSGSETVEPGIHYGDKWVGDGQSLYLKAGAVIRGKVELRNNAKVVGRGIIDGSHINNWNLIGFQATVPVITYDVSNIEIKGITIFDPNAWCVELLKVSGATIDNLKIVSSRANSDGISIQSSSNITIRNSFIRSWDDGVVVKIYQDRDSQSINVSNCIFWTDLAQSMEIGYETNKGGKGNPVISGVTFENITVFHAMHKPPISVHNGDNADIYNINFRNIVVENYQCGLGDGWNYLIDFNNLRGGWTSQWNRGSIHDCLVDNVRVLGGRSPDARFSSAEGGSINNITIRDIYVNGSKRGQFGEVNNANINWQ